MCVSCGVMYVCSRPRVGCVFGRPFASLSSGRMKNKNSEPQQKKKCMLVRLVMQAGLVSIQHTQRDRRESRRTDDGKKVDEYIKTGRMNPIHFGLIDR